MGAMTALIYSKNGHEVIVVVYQDGIVPPDWPWYSTYDSMTMGYGDTVNAALADARNSITYKGAVLKRDNMKTYLVYVLKVYFDADARIDEVEWNRYVRAESRTKALEKCLPEIIALEPKMRSVVKQYGVHVGEKNHPTAYASRLMPFSRKRERF